MIQSFTLSKHLIVTTKSWFGGKNLALAYVSLGSATGFFLCAILIFIKEICYPRKEGDEMMLNSMGVTRNKSADTTELGLYNLFLFIHLYIYIYFYAFFC